MTTNHKPATPLPSLPYRVSKMEGGKRIAIINAHSGLVTYLDCSEARGESIVHAANTYPKLVEVLRALRRVVLDRQDLHWPRLEQPLSDAAALLRDLGEVE